MADYWKSQPKKFCNYCKCWIADNKPSIDFHERGKNHKENVAKKISEIKQKSLDKAKEDEKMAKEFAAMEEAATKAYQEDLKRLGLKAEPAGQPPLPIRPEEKKEKKERKEKKEKKAKKKKKQTNGAKEWVRGFSPEGYTYYYNTNSGESQWEKPEGFRDTCRNSQKEAVWLEGIDDDGHTYYYNKDTGVSTWEKPAGFISSSIKNNPDEDSSDEDSKNQPEKRKTGSDEGKPHKPEKVGPYGEWQRVKQGKVGREKSPAPSSQKSTTLGKWEKVAGDDPYENVDLELPSTESVPVLEVSEDPKVIFKEKTVTSLGDAAEQVPVFKKRKFENGKPRNIRQRLSDH